MDGTAKRLLASMDREVRKKGRKGLDAQYRGHKMGPEELASWMAFRRKGGTHGRPQPRQKTVKDWGE